MKNNKQLKQLKSEVVRLRQIINGTNIGTWEWNVQTGETRFNERWAQIIGYTLAEISPTNIDTWLNFAHPDDLFESQRLLSAHFEGRTPYYHCEIRMKHRDGKWVWVRDHARVVSRNREGLPEWMVGSHIDITEEKEASIKLEESQRRLKQAQTLAHLGHWEVNTETGELFWSPQIFDIYGFDPESFSPSTQALNDAVHPDDMNIVKESEDQTELTGIRDVEFRIIRPDGKVRWVHEYAYRTKLHNGTERPVLIGTVQDITDRKELELRLREQSNTDALTQIYNRRYAMTFMEKKFSTTHRRSNDNAECTVISFDFDHFKQLNDKYGHAVGDTALKTLSERVKAVLRSGDIFARMGGEEFMIILPDSTINEGWILAERVREVVESIEITTRSDITHVTATLAVASFSVNDSSVEDFYIRLDDGLYKGKREGRNRVVLVENEES